MKKIIIIFLSIFLFFNYAQSDDLRYTDYKSKLLNVSVDKKYKILKEISFALEFENDIISSCVSYIKMWKEIKSEMCEKALGRMKGMMNLMDILQSEEYRNSFKEVFTKIDNYKVDKLMKETENNTENLTDNISKLTFLIKNL
tara:strand:+ start:64 stop:492 length:429 start_codon:yes stop_codon:yes gene_type:complete